MTNLYSATIAEKAGYMHSKRLLTVLGQGGVRLPYTFDPSGMSDGALPGAFSSKGGWTISSGHGVCSPTLGVELLTDGGLEGTYTGGLCAALSKTGTPTVAESADVHGGSKAQSFLADADGETLIFPFLTPEANTWYLATGWGKSTGTNANKTMYLNQIGGKPLNNCYPRAWTSASYIQRKVAQFSNSTNALYFYAVAQNTGSDFETVIIDDFSLKKITTSTMFAMCKARADVTAKAKYTWDRDGVCGVVARANASDNPSTYLQAFYFNVSNAFAYCVLWKCVSGVYTQLIADWTNAGGAGSGGIPASTEWLEIRCSGTTVRLFHNNIQVGADQTVSDVNGIYAGVFQSGGSQLEIFFVG